MTTLFSPAEWLGGWTSFERYIDADDPAMVQTWADAEQAAAHMPAMARTAEHGIRSFWSALCRTATAEQPNRIDGWRIEPAAQNADDGMALTWIAQDGLALDVCEYHYEGFIDHGFEGRTTLIFRDARADASGPFTWLIALQPMPARTEPAEGRLLSHLHFQYASRRDLLIDPNTGKLANPRWYATMCEDSADVLAQCNIVRALHRLS